MAQPQRPRQPRKSRFAAIRTDPKTASSPLVQALADERDPLAAGSAAQPPLPSIFGYPLLWCAAAIA
jgi:hypothetical protein